MVFSVDAQFLTKDKCAGCGHAMCLWSHRLDELARFCNFIIKHDTDLGIGFVSLKRYCRLRNLSMTVSIEIMDSIWQVIRLLTTEERKMWSEANPFMWLFPIITQDTQNNWE